MSRHRPMPNPISNLRGADIFCEAGTLEGDTIPSLDPVTQQHSCKNSGHFVALVPPTVRFSFLFR